MPALDGMRILDMTQYEAGTSCTQHLAWLGADVVKIERPVAGDPGRTTGSGRDPSPYFLNYNSNKRSLALALDRPEGRDLLLRMAPHYDVFVENYGPGVIEKLQIGYEVMRAINPGIIYGRIKGFGISGPYAGYQCFDQIAQAAGGAFSVDGPAEGPPMLAGATFGDSGTGLHMALAIAAAYVQRLRTGLGQQIELSMQEAITSFMRTQVAFFSDWGNRAAPRMGSRSPFSPDPIPCAPGGPNDYIYMVIVTPPMWEGLCNTIGRPDLLNDPRFVSASARRAHLEEMHTEISAWTRERTKYEAMHALAGAGVPCSAVLDTHDLWTDPHLQARNFIQTVDHPTEGAIPLMRSPILMSESQVAMTAAPQLGQHTDDVLCRDLGLSEGDLASLRAQGAIG